MSWRRRHPSHRSVASILYTPITLRGPIAPDASMFLRPSWRNHRGE